MDRIDPDPSLLRNLIDRENDGERVAFVGPAAAYVLVGACQIAVSVLPPDAPQSEAFLEVAKELAAPFAGTPIADVIEADWRAALLQRSKPPG